MIFRKRNKILILSFGAILGVAMPAVCVTSCFGSLPKDHDAQTAEQRMINMTENQVKTEVHRRLKDVGTPIHPVDWIATINELKGVKVSIGAWSTREGSVTMTVSVSKPGLITRKFGDITIDGFAYVPHIVKQTKVPMKGDNSIPSVASSFSQQIDATHYLIGTWSLGLYQVTVDPSTGMISKTTPYALGTGTNQIPNVGKGFIQQVDAMHYLVGTFANGLYQITVGSDGMITSSIPVPMSGTNSIPTTQLGFTQKIDDTHYLIGTYGDGVFELTTGTGSDVGKTMTTHQVPLALIPNVSSGFFQKIDSEHYLVGVANGIGVYEVTTGTKADNKVGVVISADPVKLSGPKGIPAVNYGFIRQINDTHYLVGTNAAGVYQVTTGTGAEVGKVISTMPVSPVTGIPIDVANGWTEQIDPAHYLMGTAKDGVFKVTVDRTTGVVITTSKLSNVPDVSTGFIQKINDAHYLIGTKDDGVHQIQVSYFS